MCVCVCFFSTHSSRSLGGLFFHNSKQLSGYIKGSFSSVFNEFPQDSFFFLSNLYVFLASTCLNHDASEGTRITFIISHKIGVVQPYQIRSNHCTLWSELVSQNISHKFRVVQLLLQILPHMTKLDPRNKTKRMLAW